MDQNFESLNLPTTWTADEEQEEDYYQSLLTDDESDSLSIISDSEVVHLSGAPSVNSSTIESHLFLSFEEILNGCKKKLDIQLVDKKGHQIDRELTCLRIKPGIESETRIAFNTFCNLIALQGDATLIVQDKPNQRFFRLSNVDIEHTVFISQANPNLSDIKIPTLENDPITLTLDDEDIDEIDSMIEVFSGRGLPDADDTSQRGNLIVRFEVTNDQVKVDNRQVYQHFEEDDVTVLIIEHSSNETAFDPKQDCPNQESSFVEEAPLVKLPSNQYSLQLSLEELYNGGSKEEPITIQVTDAKGNVHLTSKTVTVPILAGAIAGSQITLSEAGDQEANKESADAVFTLTQLPHPLFRRIGNDLEVTSRITSTEARQGTTLRMRALNNDNLTERIAGGITSTTIHQIPGYGMPIPGETEVFGNLLVKFDITLDEEKIQDPPIEHTIALSLEQIFTGCTRRVKITRMLIDSQNNEREEDKILSLTIKPGTRSGTRLSFPKEGDQNPGRIPADITFIVRDKADERFLRKGAHLECTETVFRSQIINEDTVEVRTFKDGPKLIALNGRNNWKRLPGFGLPYEEDSNRRGDLIVKFNIIDDPKDETIEYDLKLSLEEVVKGCTKRRKIFRKTFDPTGREIEEKSEILAIEIPPGVQEGRQFTFSGYGNRHPGVLPADISFIIRYKDHPHFDVIEGNLSYTVLLTEHEIDQNIPIEIPTLEKETLTLYSRAAQGGDVRRFANRGLPSGENAIKRGPLSIKFSIRDANWKGLPLIEKLPLTPNQLITGCVVKRTLSRQIVNKRGQSMGMETKEFHLNVQPKSKIGHELRFYRAASQLANQIPGDVIFQICKTNAHQKNEKEAFDQSERSPIEETLVYQLPLSLVDILRGGIKHMSIERNVLQANGSIIPERKSIEIPFVKGIETGKRIAFPGLGDERQGHPPGNIEFEVVDAAHSLFTRFGCDIQYTAKITPSQIVSQDQLPIPTIEGDSIPLKLTRQMVECQSKEIEGFGLPIAANSNCRGKLIVNFEIYPEQRLPNRKLTGTRENTRRLHLSLTLEQIALGFKERVTFTFDHSRPIRLPVKVQPGEQFGREWFYPKRQANTVAGSDVILVLTEKRHQHFRRDGANLIYIARITPNQALKGGTIEVPLLRKGKLKLHLRPHIQPGDYRDIPNEGLPICGKPTQRGKLRVYFKIGEGASGLTKMIENVIGFFSH